MHQIHFRPELHPGPRWGSLQRSPILPSWLNGALCLSRGEGKERSKVEEAKGREGERQVGDGKGEEAS